MELINTVVGVPLGTIMYFSYELVRNYGWAILLFALITKLLMFPLSLVSQKNSIKMVKMQPLLEDIKQRNAGNPGLVLSEQKALYKKEKYSSLAGVLPLLIQVPLILGLINVVYNPLQHLLHIPPEVIAQLAQQAGLPAGASAQIDILKAMQTAPDAFAGILQNDAILQQILHFNFSFLGMDLSVVPTAASLYIIVPILSGLSSLLLSALQNKHNVLQQEQGFVGKWGTALFLVAFSVYFAFLVPAGIGLYWIAGNLLSIVVLFACNWVYNPAQYIDYASRPVKRKPTKEERQARQEEKRQQKAREKQDDKRFFDRPKQLVFYSESSGFYKYFSHVIDYILAHSDLDIHYVTNDFHDAIFQKENPRIYPYYIGPTRLISFMMRMDADMVVMTTPDLELFHIKRSLVKKDVEYVYLDHGMTSFHLMLREHALDHFDTIFCYGPNHMAEVRETEKLYGLPEKKLVKTGYGLLEDLLAKVDKLPKTERNTKQILIGPSWQKDSLLEFCLDPLLAQLLHRGYRVILRPHPEFVKRFPGKIQAIQEQYKDEPVDEFLLETDFSSNETVYTSDVVITDWSSIAQEFSYATKRPSIFINTPMKVMNPNYDKIESVPLDISLRDQIGVSVDPGDLSGLPAIVEEMVTHPEAWREKITKVLEENIFYVGDGAEAAGTYIIGALREKAQGKAKELPKESPKE